MTEQQSPKIEFPCDYEIRIMGKSAPDFKDVCLDIIKKHAPEFDGSCRIKPSRAGTFESVMVKIVATGESQLAAIHADLKATGRVTMVI